MATATAELLARRSSAVAAGLAAAHPVAVTHASGAILTDAEGNEYIDLISGIGVMNVGHGHPRVLAAVREQLERFTHLSFQVTSYEGYVAVAEKLNQVVPTRGPRKSLLLSTGAEAVENAVKMARAWTGRSDVIAFAPSFHGRTLLTMSMTGKVAGYKQGFGPYAPGIHLASYPHPGAGVPTDTAIRSFTHLLETQVEPDRVAAVIIEPVAGEGGFLPAPTDFLRFLRDWCDQNGAVLICDEIQTGFGRTGRMFACEHHGIEPDLITSAKSLAAGLPLAAVTGLDRIVDAPGPGGLGGTYAGNPLACAAALAVFEIMEDGRLLEQALRLGERLRTGLESVWRRHDCIREVRALGCMVAFEFGATPANRAAEAAMADAAIAEARRRGVLLLKAGLHNNVVRLLAPLSLTDDQADRALAAIGAAVAAVDTRPVQEAL